VHPRPTARVIATVAALAVALVGLLPSEHVHAAEDHPIVHRHVIADAGVHLDDADHHHGASVGHGDHARARLLTLSFLTTSPFAMVAPIAVTTAALIAPTTSQTRLPATGTLPPTHDPPLRFVSSPAPPARS
jgi:hypothetical protein